MTNVREIAKLAGVAPSTVSRALNGHPQIAESTRQRIQTLATEFGYVPNRLSRGICSGDSGLLGLITHQNIGPGYAEMMQGAMTQAFAEGYGLISIQPMNEPSQIFQAVHTLISMRVQGIIFAHAGAPVLANDLVFAIRSSGVYLVELTQNLTSTPVDQISMEIRTAFWLAAEYLYQLGHRRLALFYSPQRRDDYPSMMADACACYSVELAYQQLVHSVPDLVTALNQSLQLPSPPTAIIIQNDMFAWNALLMAEQRRVHVPNDLSIIGIGDLFHGEIFPELSTIAVRYREVGYEAIKWLSRHIQEKIPPSDLPPKSLVLPPYLLARKTTAPLNRRHHAR